MNKMTLVLTRAAVMAIVAGMVGAVTPAVSQNAHSYAVEGHVFSAETLRPLPNAIIELWSFLSGSPNIAYGAESDEGGFYRYEFTPLEVDENGEDTAEGYAFAYICLADGKPIVQIVPLYTRLRPGHVYQRNVYMNVPAGVRSCSPG